MSEMSTHTSFFVKADTPIEVAPIQGQRGRMTVSFGDSFNEVTLHTDMDGLRRLAGELKFAIFQYGVPPLNLNSRREELVSDVREIVRAGVGPLASDAGVNAPVK